MRLKEAKMINSRRLYDACFNAAVRSHKPLLPLSLGLPWLSRFGP